MNTRKVATAVVAALALAGAGAGTAVAASNGPSRAHQASSEPTAPDTDNLQVGDQTSPDSSAAGAAKAVGSTGIGASHARAGASGDESTSENENAPEDGPGGHADPSGDVQHEFNGVE
jgi:hypothetical protein